jgi:hypothetical protein
MFNIWVAISQKNKQDKLFLHDVPISDVKIKLQQKKCWQLWYKPQDREEAAISKL